MRKQKQSKQDIPTNSFDNDNEVHSPKWANAASQLANRKLKVSRHSIQGT